MAIKQIDKKIAQMLLEELNGLLKAFGEQHGVAAKRAGGATFTPENIRFSIEIAVLGESGDVMSREALDFQQFARMYDLAPEILFKTFKYKGSDFKVVGLKSRAGKMPILCTNMSDGSRHKFAAELIKKFEEELLGKQ